MCYGEGELTYRDLRDALNRMPDDQLDAGVIAYWGRAGAEVIFPVQELALNSEPTLKGPALILALPGAPILVGPRV